MYICISVSQGMAGNCHCFGVRLQVGQGGEFDGIQLYIKRLDIRRLHVQHQ